MDAMDKMDADKSHSTSQHRPPVLFQSDENDQVLHGHSHEHNDHLSSPLHPLSYGPGDETLSRHKLDFDHDDLLEYRGVLEEDPPAHVHSQACRDSCPVQDIYTETSYSRFGRGARTNLYGLAVIKELENASPPPPSALSISSLQGPRYSNSDTFVSPDAPDLTGDNKPSKGSNIFTSDGSMAYSHLPARYVLVAAGGAIKCFMGLQESFEFTLGAIATGSGSNAGTGTNSSAGSGNESGTGAGIGSGSENGQGAANATSPMSNQEIVSMDAFERKDQRGCQLVVVASIARGEDPTHFELRFYGANTFGNSIRELLLGLPTTKDIQSIPLSWAPTKIIHSPMEVDPFEMAVLVAGSDSCVHYFVQEPSLTEVRTFGERSVELDISIFASFPYCEYCVLSLVIKDYLTCRVVAAGTQNGTLNVSIIPRDLKTQKLNRANAINHTVVLFAPITTLTVFTSRVLPERPKRMNCEQQEGGEDRQSTEAISAVDPFEEVDDRDTENTNIVDEASEEGIHLLVTCAIEQAWVYSNINKHGLGQRSDLAECSYHDSILTAYIMDSDWDGRNELMIGTYGRQLMVFKELPTGQAPFPPNASSNISENFQYSHHLHPQDQDYTPQQQHHPYHPSHLSHLTASDPSPIPQWSMTWNRRFASPVYGISSADLNDDGLEELVITTLNGVSIFLPDPATAKRRLAQAVGRMREIEEMRLTLEKLRKSNEQLWEKHKEKQKREKEEENEMKERLGKEENDRSKSEKEVVGEEDEIEAKATVKEQVELKVEPVETPVVQSLPNPAANGTQETEALDTTFVNESNEKEPEVAILSSGDKQQDG
ncbi:hypothetical protein BGX26_005701 [Mortierella sp. AD094]|nr:hypothetical protein BGX26_005701 [Mortierella sp. AD094]